MLRLVHAPVVILFYCGLLTLSRRIPELPRMRALAFPGEEPEQVKPPETVAAAILERLASDVPTGEKVRVEA